MFGKLIYLIFDVSMDAAIFFKKINLNKKTRAATPESSAYIRIKSGVILAPDKLKSEFESGVSTPASQP